MNLFFLGAIIIKLGGKFFAQLIGCLAFLLGVYLRTSMLFQPNAFEYLCWTLLALIIINYIQTGQSKWLIWFGIVGSIALMNKYSTIFFIIGILIGALATSLRKVFRKPTFYIGLLLAILIVSPNLWWQYQHNYPFFHHMAELKQTQLDHISPVSFLFGQLLICLPGLLLWISGLYVLFFKKWARPYLIMGISYLILIIILLIFHGKDYYSLGAYPMLMAIGAVHMEKWSLSSFLYLKRFSLLAFTLFFGFYLVPVGLPLFQPAKEAKVMSYYQSVGILKWEDGKDHSLPQDYADMLGWKRMTFLVNKAYTSLSDSEKAHTIIHCDNYGKAGAVTFYGRAYQLPPAHSMNASFLLWTPNNITFQNLIYVSEFTPDPQKLKKFRSATLIGKITDRLAREYGTEVWLLKGASPSIIKFYQNELQQKKQLFIRQ